MDVMNRAKKVSDDVGKWGFVGGTKTQTKGVGGPSGNPCVEPGKGRRFRLGDETLTRKRKQWKDWLKA